MRTVFVCWVILAAGLAAWAESNQESLNQGPASPKAQKSYARGEEEVKRRQYVFALDDFKSADKQDGGKCLACQQEIVFVGSIIGNFKAAEAAANEMIAEAHDPVSTARAHDALGMALLREAEQKKKQDIFSAADDEFKKALATAPNFPDALYADGFALASLGRDDQAKAQFRLYLTLSTKQNAERGRAQRFLDHPELARARMAPAFTVTTMDGRTISLDDLAGKVVLIDFWATWCGPCREALPHLEQVAKKFQGQPLVILSVSLDADEAKWKDFVAKNKMTWLQYRDGGFQGPISQLFGVQAIPSTFTIDTDGILQDQHIGDASIEGKLKKLCANAEQVEEAQKNTP